MNLLLTSSHRFLLSPCLTYLDPKRYCYRQSRHSKLMPPCTNDVLSISRERLRRKKKFPVTSGTGTSDAKKSRTTIVGVSCKCWPKCVRKISSFPMWLDDELDSSKTQSMEIQSNKIRREAATKGSGKSNQILLVDKPRNMGLCLSLNKSRDQRRLLL